MKEYQEALQFAAEKKYPESLVKLREAAQVVENITGSQSSAYHLYLF